MKASHFTVASILLNVVLAVAALKVTRTASPNAGASSEETALSSNHASLLRTNVIRLEVMTTNDAPAFHWAQVQSEDFEKYVANLRAIGCPEDSIRDIIRGALVDIFLERRRGLLEPVQRDYWNLIVHGMGAIQTRTRKDIEQLSKETIDRLNALVSPKTETRKPASRHWEIASFLPEDKQRQFVELNHKFDEQLRALPRVRGKDGTDRAEKEKDVQRQRDEAINDLLTPEELAEYKLRTSRYAGVGANLVGVEMSVDELRALTRTFEQFPSGDKLGSGRRTDAVKSLLGEERFADYQRSGDSSFQQIYQVTERYQLPRETAVQADDLRKAAVEAAKQLRQNSALSNEERLAALQQIQQETRAALDQTFGSRAAVTYQKHGGEWLRKLVEDR